MLRIVAGQLRGRRLVAPRDRETRPTSDRVREALFSILGPLDGVVLDLYAGSGALGIEALSRGADRAVFVESRKPALDALRGNLQELAIQDCCVVIPRLVERAISQIIEAKPFTLIMVDPPYRLVKDEQTNHILKTLLNAGCLAEGGRLVLEHANRTVPPEFSGYERGEPRCYGDTALSFYEALREKG